MARKKYYYYVLVFTDAGPKYVTSIDSADRVAHWNVDEKPRSMTKDDAEFLAVALTWNGNSAVMVTSTYEIESHPYNYADYKIEFVEKEDAENE